jgi:threonine synthase
MMRLYSTRDVHRMQEGVSFEQAVMRGLAPDGGLFVPENIPSFDPAFFEEKLPNMAFPEIAFSVAAQLLDGAIPREDLQSMIHAAINFPAPVHRLNNSVSILELFHGPSLAFKDFGARFMAQLMAYFNQSSQQELTILVATSGDTGAAVAAGFHGLPGIRVFVLYPEGKVSPFQELQIAGWGDNIHAVKVAGDFDDCQRLVKAAFADHQINRNIRFTSANSINISRLLAQIFYYFEAYKQWISETKGVADKPKLVFSVPSGNFGNLTAGLYAQKMGLPVDHFIAATNANDVFPAFLASGHFKAQTTIATVSNAMDVGNPSNFERIESLYQENTTERSTWNNIRAAIGSLAVSDEDTLDCIQDVFRKYHYLLDPHTAVGVFALEAWKANNPDRSDAHGIVLATAHPFKFREIIEPLIGEELQVPAQAGTMKIATDKHFHIDPDLKYLKKLLLEKTI